jgi:hypothetical protein
MGPRVAVAKKIITALEPRVTLSISGRRISFLIDMEEGRVCVQGGHDLLGFTRIFWAPIPFFPLYSKVNGKPFTLLSIDLL